jgi:hypothetical protein
VRTRGRGLDFPDSVVAGGLDGVSGSEKKIALLYDRVTTETYSHSSPVHTQYSKTSLQLKILEVDFSRALTYPSVCSKNKSF